MIRRNKRLRIILGGSRKLLHSIVGDDIADFIMGVILAVGVIIILELS